MSADRQTYMATCKVDFGGEFCRFQKGEVVKVTLFPGGSDGDSCLIDRADLKEQPCQLPLMNQLVFKPRKNLPDYVHEC